MLREESMSYYVVLDHLNIGCCLSSIPFFVIFPVKYKTHAQQKTGYKFILVSFICQPDIA